MIAALYIDPRGPYPAMADVDCWDESRDARLYDGPHPVVAHPPCRNWSRVRHLAKGNDSDCAVRAVEQVRAFGGVLEHPAGSLLWSECGLPRVSWSPCWPDWLDTPSAPSVDAYGGYSIEVEQVEWLHACRKRTWLYLVGVPREALEVPPFHGRKPTHWCSGGRTGGSRKGSPIPPGIKAASGPIKRRTPPLFAEYLVRLARSVQR